MKKAILVCFLSATAAWADTAPKIEFDRTLYDFGTTSLVEVVSGKFTFRNAGDGVLKLQEPKPSCGCTVAKLSSDTLQPGETGELAFTLRFVNGNGVIEKDIIVPSNDPQNPSLKLTIKVNVIPIVTVSPAMLFLGDIAPGESGAASVVVKRPDGKKLSITKAEGGKDFVTINVEPIDESQGRMARITATTVKADGSPRRFTDIIQVYTPDSLAPAVLIPLYGRFLSQIVLTPEALVWTINDPKHWPGADPEQTTSRLVAISRSDENQPLHVRNVTSSLKELHVELSIVETGLSYRIEATLSQPPSESMQGDISFETDLPDLPKVNVPVAIDVSEP